jgi:hypothetical protein
MPATSSRTPAGWASGSRSSTASCPARSSSPPEQSYLQPPLEQTDVVHVIKGVIEAENEAIETGAVGAAVVARSDGDRDRCTGEHGFCDAAGEHAVEP